MPTSKAQAATGGSIEALRQACEAERRALTFAQAQSHAITQSAQDFEAAHSEIFARYRSEQWRDASPKKAREFAELYEQTVKQLRALANEIEGYFGDPVALIVNLKPSTDLCTAPLPALTLDNVDTWRGAVLQDFGELKAILVRHMSGIRGSLQAVGIRYWSAVGDEILASLDEDARTKLAAYAEARERCGGEPTIYARDARIAVAGVSFLENNYGWEPPMTEVSKHVH